MRRGGGGSGAFDLGWPLLTGQGELLDQSRLELAVWEGSKGCVLRDHVVLHKASNLADNGLKHAVRPLLVKPLKEARDKVRRRNELLKGLKDEGPEPKGVLTLQ